MPTVKRQKAICKKKGALGKWQGGRGKIYKREPRDVKQVARQGIGYGKASQNKVMQAKGIKYLVSES